MNAFGEALNLVFMRRSDALVPISLPMDLKTAFPWVPIPSLWISRLHSHESLFPCQWISRLRLHSMSSYSTDNGSQDSDCIPMSPYSTANESQDCIPMSSYSTANESQDSECIPMSSYSTANESQDCIPWVPIPSLWISRLRMHSMSPYFPAKFLESFGWVPPMSCHPASNVPIETPKNCILARF